MRYVSLFSGIEAASVAWRPLGWEPIAFSEIEPFPCNILRARFPEVPNLGDIREVDWSSYAGAVELIVGGSPCQAFSIAGKRKGLMDERGRLMLEYVRAVERLRPRWVLWENVPGVLSNDGGRAFGTLLGALAQLGYSLAWRVLDAQFFGVAQQRRRVFLIGHSDAGRAASVLFERSSVSENTCKSGRKRKRLAGESSGKAKGCSCLTPWDTQTNRIYEADGIWPTLFAGENAGMNRQAVFIPRKGGGELRRLMPIECERLQGFPDNWTKLDSDTPDSPRYKALGNSMAVPVINWLGRQIREVDAL